MTMAMPPPIHVGSGPVSPRLGPHRGPDTARVSFNVAVETRWGDTVVITGSSEQLGRWQPERGLRLTTDEHTYPAWRCSEPLVMSRLDVEYKVVIMRAPNATPEWEPLDDNQNRLLPLTRLDPTVSVAIGWGELCSSPRARAAHMRAPPPPLPTPAPIPYHTGLTPPLRPISLADAPRRRRSSAPALHYQPRGGSVVSSGNGRQNSNSNSPCAGPEFPETMRISSDPCALPPSLLNCPPALGNSPIVGEMAAGVPHPAGIGFVAGPCSSHSGGSSGFYSSTGLYACPGPVAAGRDPRLPLRMLNYGEPLNAIMSMDQSWPPSLSSSIDMNGSQGGLEQAGSRRVGSKESMLEKSPSELMASVGEGEEAGADESAPHATGTMPPPWPARRVPPASSSPASSPPRISSPPPTPTGVLGGVLGAQGNPAAAQRWGVSVEQPPSAGYASPRRSPPAASTAGQGVQVMPPACNSFSIPPAAGGGRASPSASDAARREQLRTQLQQRPALP